MNSREIQADKDSVQRRVQQTRALVSVQVIEESYISIQARLSSEMANAVWDRIYASLYLPVMGSSDQMVRGEEFQSVFRVERMPVTLLEE